MARAVVLGLATLALAGCERREPDYSAAERLAMVQEQGGLDPYGEAAFADADVDRAGAVTRDQFKAAAMRTFARLDKNGDQVLVSEERWRRPGEPAPDPPRPSITADAFHESLDAKFRAADADGDGKLSRQEWGEVPWRDGEPEPRAEG